MIFFVFGYLLFMLYCSWLIRVYIGLKNLKPIINNYEPTISIIIPVRNEQENIVRCLDSLIHQNYEPAKYDIWVVDDHSSDSTVTRIVENYGSHGTVHLLRLATTSCLAPKKAAIAAGIAASQGEIICTIDADCLAPRNWLRHLAHTFAPDTGMVAGWVAIDPQKTKHLFHRLQALEFLGLVTAGAGTLASGYPLSVNGANLAYRRTAFLEVMGFMGNDHVTSGDDVFLMRKLHHRNWKINFAPQADAMVLTSPANTIQEFLHQRKRWASKGLDYQNTGITLFLIALYLFNLVVIISIPLACSSLRLFWLTLPILTGKLVMDFLVVAEGARQMKLTNLLFYFPLAEFFQVSYILMVGLASFSKQFQWKGRIYSRQYYTDMQAG